LSEEDFVKIPRKTMDKILAVIDECQAILRGEA